MIKYKLVIIHNITDYIYMIKYKLVIIYNITDYHVHDKINVYRNSNTDLLFMKTKIKGFINHCHS